MQKNPTRVLVVEGDPDDASVIGSYLACAPGNEDDLVVTHAPRLSTACHLLARQQFDAILLDLAVPVAADLEAFLKIRSISPAPPILLLTGKKNEALAERAVDLGADDRFIKGSPDCLLLKRAVRHAIERRRLARWVEELLGADPVPKLVLDRGGAVRFANAAVEPLLGRAPADLLGKPLSLTLPDAGAAPVAASIGTQEKRVKIGVKEIVWYGAPARLVSLAVEREEGSGELDALEAGNHFLGRISHELRNTLATMKTAAYCLKEGSEEKLAPGQEQLVDMISRNINRQTRIVENILDLARFRSGKLKIRLQESDAASIIRQLGDEYRLSRGARILEIDIGSEIPSVLCDPDLIAQVLRNLLDNALRFAKQRIVIGAAQAGPDTLSISVTDDGAGIPEEHLGRLFTHFQRLDGDSGEQHKGTGLGLAICKEIIEGHNGRMRVENAKGLGARFSFDLPLGGAVPTTDLGEREPAPTAMRKRSYLLHK